VHDPHTLIFDEPTAGLDMTASFELLARASGNSLPRAAAWSGKRIT